jgi:multidrug efflux system outer membrane protein
VEVSDPLLTPVPPAPNTLTSWRDAMDRVLARSPDLRIAEQEVRRAEGLSRQALAGVLPRVTASGSVTHNLITTEVPAREVTIGGTSFPVSAAYEAPATPVALAQLNAAWPLSPRAYYALGTSELGVRAAERTFEDKQRTVIAAVASAIVSVVTAERITEVSRVGLESALARQELMRRRVRLGSGTSLDTLRAEQDVTSARSTVLQADESLRKSREALGLALGSNEPFGVTPSVSLDEIATSARSMCTPASPESRADVIAARTQREIAERAVTDAKLLYAPTAEVSTTFSLSSETLANTKSYAWSIQGVLSVPIFDGGARYGTARAATAAATQQAELVEVAQRRASLEAQQALRSVSVAEAARDLSTKSSELARETERLSRVAYEAGAGTSFELVDSARRAREAELDLAVKEFQLVSAKITALLAAANCSPQ